MADQPQVDPAQLAEAVKGMSDEELAKTVKDMGVDETLKNIFEGMRDSFKPEAAKDVNATVQYDVDSGEGVKQWSVTFADGTCSVKEGTTDSPRLTIAVGLVDFIRLIFNQVQGPQLFMSGKMKLQGDMMWAMQMQNYFERNF
jgi:putative sterol carrier protein